MWGHTNGHFTWVSRNTTGMYGNVGSTTTSVAPSEASPPPSSSGGFPGFFVGVDNQPAENATNPAVRLSGSNSGGVGDAYVVHEPAAELSGIYDKTINGVSAGKVVVIARPDGSFIMASTKSDQLEELKLRLDGLVGST
jgi:hypothetical protein